MSETKLPEFPVYEINPKDLPTVIKDFPPLVKPIPKMPIAPPETPDSPLVPEPQIKPDSKPVKE
jgi:hypothetical protein